MKLIPLILAALVLPLLIACEGVPRAASKSTPDSPGKDGPRTHKSAKTVSPEVLARYCGQPPGPAPTVAKVLKDSSGNIGGYSHRLLIVDSPIFYLDSAGEPLAMFHIFGSDEEKKKNRPLIDALLKAFPVEEDLPCPDPEAPPAP